MIQKFDGADYVHERDAARLTLQLSKIWDLMADKQWRTLREIADATGAPEASVSAQLRHLRKPRFGSHKVERMRTFNGLNRYRVVPNVEASDGN